MATILVRHNAAAGPSAPPAPAPATRGELLLAFEGFTAALGAHANGNELAVDTGTGILPLIGPQRQVELVGAQTITGRKTFALTALSIIGGTADQVLTTDGAGNLTWETVAAGGPALTIGRGLTETAGTVDLNFAGVVAPNIGGVFVPANSGLTLTPATGQLVLTVATAALLGGVSVPAGGGLVITAGAVALDPATQAEATTGTDNAKPITALVLKLGADPATLTTTAKTLVPAINELANILGSISTGLLQIVGTFDAAADDVTPITGSTMPAGPLPAADQARVGQFVLVDTAGTPPAGNAPQVPMIVNDMVVCVEVMTTPGTYAWAHTSLGQAVVAASGVTVTAIPGMTATNVQDALAELETSKLDGPLVIDASLSGDGTAATPLAVAIVNGGTY